MKRLAFLFAFLAAFLLQADADAASMSKITVSPTTVSGGASVTGTVYLSSAAGSGGEVISLSSSSSKANVPATVTVPQGKSSAKFTITTDEISSRTYANISATVDGSTKTVKLTIDPLALSSVSINPTTVTAETTATGTIKLNGKAKTGGFVVSLSSNSSYLDVPATVIVPAGATTVTFEATASDTSASRSVTVSAVASGVTKTAKVTVAPLNLKSVTSSTSVNSGRPITPKVNMTGMAPEGGAVVTLNSNRPSILPVPATVTVPEGATYLSVPLTANFVSTPTQVTVTARFNGVSKSVVITVKPVVVSSLSASTSAPTGSLPTTFKVTLSAPAVASGYSVALSSSHPDLVPIPDTLFVAGGATTASIDLSTAYVTEPTEVTLSTTLNGETKTYKLTVMPVQLSSVSYTSSVTGGLQTAMTINLKTYAPEGGVEIALVSSDPTLISLPESVTVPGGEKTLQVAYTPAVSMSSPVVTVLVTDGSVQKTLTITIKKPKIYSVSLNSAITTGGTATTGTVLLTGPAPEGGAVVQLSGNSPAIVPTEIFIPAGVKEVSMSFNTLPVAARTQVTISATWDGVTFNKNLTIDPPALKDLVPRPLTLAPGGTSPLTVRLTGPAPEGGYVVTLQSTSPSVASVPASVTVPAGASQATFQVTVPANASNGQSTTIRATADGKSTEAAASVTTLTMTSFSISAPSVIGGTSLTGTVTLSGPAPVGGLTVDVFTLDPSVTPSSTIIVAPGQSSVTFPIATDFVSESSSVVIYASFTSSGLTQDLTLTPLRPSTLTLDVADIEGGDTAVATLTLNGPAPAAGGLQVSVDISASNGAVMVPTNVVFAPGASSATFSVIGVPVATDTSVTITADFNGGSASASLEVHPPQLESMHLDLEEVTGGHQMTGTVALTSPAPAEGWLINLTGDSSSATVPGSVLVLGGETSATFEIATVPVAVNTDVTVEASKDLASKSSVFTIIPPRLTSLTVNDTDLEGGFANAGGTVFLDGAAPSTGWQINLSSNNGSAMSVDASVIVPAGETSASFVITSHVVASDTIATVTASRDARTFSSDVTIRAIKVTSLTLSTSSVTGGTVDVTATVSINRALPAGAMMIVNLSEAHDAASVPVSVIFGGNEFSRTFSISTTPVASNKAGQITASFNGSANASLTVVPPVPISVSMSPDPAIGAVDVVTGVVTLNGPAPEGNAVVELEMDGVSASVPASVTIAQGLASGSFSVTTSAVLLPEIVTLEATYQAVTVSDSLTVEPVPLNGLSLSPSTVIGGAANSTATITTAVNAPAGGTMVSLTSSNSSVATVPATVFIPAGSNSATFQVTSAVTSTSKTSVITASFGGETRTATLTVNPLVISTINLSKITVQGGSENTTATVTMNAAPMVDTEIALSSSNTAAATVPATATVLAGQTSVTVTVTSFYQNATANLTISATYNTVTKTVNMAVTAVKLNSMTVSPATVVGGVATASGSVSLSTAVTAPLSITLTSDNEAASVPATVIVPVGQSSASFTITTLIVASAQNTTISAAFNGTTKTAALTVNPYVITSVTLNKSSVVGGAENLTATVTLNGMAPAGGTEVSLEVSPSSHASVPATITVAAGSATGTATITTYRQAANAEITVSASYNGSSASASAMVKGPVVSSVTIAPSPVLGGTSTTGTVALDVTAPAGGLVVDLAASNSAATVPATVTVAEGETTASFMIGTTPVANNRSVTITATVNSVAKTGGMQVNAPGVASLEIDPDDVVGGTSSTATVTLTSPAPAAGYVVTLSDNNGATAVNNITVAAGETVGSSSITTVAVTSNTTSTVTATANGSAASHAILVRAPVITSLVINPNSVRGGNSTTATITISSEAPSGGLTIVITDSSSNVGTPSSVVVPAGQTSVSFTITTNTVSTNQTKVVTAKLNGVNTTANITLTKN